MFDQETAQFFQMLRSNTIGESASIGLRSILESNIPANVKAFFRADVEYLRAREKAREVRSSKFAFTIPEVRLLEEQIDLLLVNNYTFTRKDFDATADKCIHFLLNYLCRPQWTLNSFFFDDTIRITADEMLSKLRYCSDYAYYRTVLAKYAEARQRTDVGSEEMKRLLKTIDDEVCGAAGPKDLVTIARPIFDFVGTIRASMKPPLPVRVPVRALIYFFEDKRLTKFADALASLREKENGIELTPAMLGLVLEAAQAGSPIPDPAALKAASERAPEEEAPLPAGNAAHADEGAAVAHTPPLQQPHASGEMPGLEDQTDDRPRAAARRDEGPESTLAAPNLPPGSDDFPPADTEPVEAGPKHEGPVEVTPPYFSEGDREAIVTTLFRGDEAMFNEAIGEAANTRTWDEAINTLDRFFAERGIDPFSKEAMMFTNILESWHRTLTGSEPAE